MERINGRVAITVMAELDLGLRKLSDDEMAYVFRQAASFRDWFIKEHKMTLEEAKEACRNLYDRDVELLQQVDPYADFIWSRGQEVGQAEIDLAGMADMDFEGNADAEHRSHQEYWASMERTAEYHVGKLSSEQWAASSEKFMEIMDYINKLAGKFVNKLLTSKDHITINKTDKRVNDLRFGKQPVLTYRHWAIAHNMLVNLRGVGKVMKVSAPVEPDPEDVYQDAMSFVSHSLDQEQAYDNNDN